jgi:hypothetical protein
MNLYLKLNVFEKITFKSFLSLYGYNLQNCPQLFFNEVIKSMYFNF